MNKHNKYELTEEDKKLWNAVTQGMTQQIYKPGLLPLIKKSNRIDLHGYTLEAAYSIIISTIENTSSRRILFITGKSGEIKKHFIDWIRSSKISGLVSSIKPENEGSYWVNLKKIKN